MQILDLTPEPWFAKFLIVHSEDETKPMAKVSPFTIARDLERTIGKSYNARKLTTGDLQIEVTTRQQSSALHSLDKIADISVTVTTHRTLNIVKGVISESQLLDCSDTEIEEGLKDQGVVTARRIVMRRDGFLRPSKQAILTAMYVRISRIRDAVSSASVLDMVRRSVEDTRSVQNVLDHSAESCANEVRCANCKGSHPVYSRSCPRWQEEKEILKMKVTQNISYREAKTQVEFARKGTFSEVVRRGVAPLRKSVETQTSGSPPHTPPTQEKPAESLLPLAPAAQVGSREVAATTSTEVDGELSVWDGLTGGSSQAATHTMDVDDDDCMSQKSSSSLPPNPSPWKEQRTKKGGRGRGSTSLGKHKPPRVTPPT
ncbi:uncharacterized protein LOC135374377 [Ornithodoros turicata]|uniref:uncharacterized protein LOC135374377 n=1 Tax=Ornithodoros turicata TaxID=34597 RepID=UPI003139BEEA